MKETSDFSLSLISVVSQCVFLTWFSCWITILKLRRTILILPSFYLHHTSPLLHIKKLVQYMYEVYNVKIFLVSSAFVSPIIFHTCNFQCQNFFLSWFLYSARYNGIFLTYGYICIPNSKNQSTFSFSNSSKLVPLLFNHK